MSPSNDTSAGAVPTTPNEGQPSVTPLANGGTPTTPQPLPTIPLPASSPAPTPTSPQPGASPSSQSSGYLVAEDKDVIEPEWVNGAKTIVSRNQDDPYKQSEELTVFKAEYMQKRYNKTIKLK